jgi:hypothetical protein
MYSHRPTIWFLACNNDGVSFSRPSTHHPPMSSIHQSIFHRLTGPPSTGPPFTGLTGLTGLTGPPFTGLTGFTGPRFTNLTGSPVHRSPVHRSTDLLITGRTGPPIHRSTGLTGLPVHRPPIHRSTVLTGLPVHRWDRWTSGRWTGGRCTVTVASLHVTVFK